MYRPILEKALEKTVEKTVKEGDSRRGKRMST
jgi:hypothetical protein